MADTGDFVAGLVIGGLLGFLVGVMAAPAPGSETRVIIADKTQAAVKGTRENVEEVSGVVKESVAKVVDLVKDKLPECSCSGCDDIPIDNGAEPV